MTIIDAKNLDPTVSIEDYLTASEFDEESIFFSNMRTKTWPVNLVTKDIDLPELDSGRFEFGTIYNQIVVKINADEYLTQPPKEARPHLNWRPYNVFGYFEKPKTLNILCFENN